MSNHCWSKWGDPNYDEQTVGFDGTSYYVKAGGGRIYADMNEIDDLIYQLMRLKRKVEGE